MAERRMTLALFGAFDFRVDGSPVNLGLSGPTRSMLQYLVCCTGRLTRREQLMEMFWSGTSPERRRSSLNSAIWRIKKALRTADAPAAFAIDATAECVRMAGTRSPEVDIDAVSLADAFAAASAPGAGEADVERLLATLNGCDGTPLDGLDDDTGDVDHDHREHRRRRALVQLLEPFAAEVLGHCDAAGGHCQSEAEHQEDRQRARRIVAEVMLRAAGEQGTKVAYQRGRREKEAREARVAAAQQPPQQTE